MPDTLALKVFSYKDKEVRTIEEDGEIWFVAKDVCDILEIQNVARAAQEELDEDEKGIRNVYTPGGMQKMTVINEPGVYALVFKSRKPEAKDFSRWVRHEVLPSIRKHRMYATPAKIEDMLENPDAFIKALQAYKEEKAKRESVEAEKLALEAKAQEDRPKVIFAEALETSKNSILIGDFAKILRQNGIEIGQNRLFVLLREEGYLIRRRGESWNMPTQESLERGLFDVKTRIINDADGSTRITHTTKITGKGQIYFVNHFKSLKA